jgi:urease accessory protein
MPASAARPNKAASWEARLQLGIQRVGARSVLARRAHRGPLVVQKPFYPEGDGCVHLVIVHPPGGIAEGDDLDVEVDVGDGARVLLTTPGATKWYKCSTESSLQRVRFAVAGNATAEWLPQENILFDGSRSRLVADVELAKGARFAGWEILCFGRRASGERFTHGRFDQRVHIRRAGVTVRFESAAVQGDDPQLHSPVGLANCSVSGTFLIASEMISQLPLTLLREITVQGAARCGITRLPEVLVARYLGDSAEDAKAYFTSLWKMLRPSLCGREASAPRIWTT